MACFAVHFPNEPTKVNRWQKAMLDKMIEWKSNGNFADGGIVPPPLLPLPVFGILFSDEAVKK